jgi:hypothetical protein
MAVTAAAVEEVLHAPLPRCFAIECAALRRPCTAVDHIVVRDHQHLVRRRELRNAQRVQLALCRHDDAVVDHDEIRIRVHDLAWFDAR